MKRYTLLLAAALVLLSAAPGTVRAQEDTQQELAKRLSGSWRMVARKWRDAEEFTDVSKEKNVTIKHVTPAGAAWVTYDTETGAVIGGAGGTWLVRDGLYCEKYLYGVGDVLNAVGRDELVFTCKLEGNRWTHAGTLPNGFKLEEIWERVPAGESEDQELAGKLAGAWRMAAFKYDIPKELVENPDVPKENQITLKLVTPAGFLWVTRDPETGKVTRCAGGTWSARGGKCVEKAQYGQVGGFELLRGQELAYECKLEGDRWEQSADFPNGVKIQESWDRVKAEGEAK